MSTVAAYRDRWHIEGQGPLGPAPDRETTNRPPSARRRQSAGKWARAISSPAVDQPNNHGVETHVEISRGIEL